MLKFHEYCDNSEHFGLSQLNENVMERRSPRTQLSCMWGLFSVMESCQGRTSRKLISNGRPVNKHAIDYPRKLDQLASFDEECRRIQIHGSKKSRRVVSDAKPTSFSLREMKKRVKHTFGVTRKEPMSEFSMVGTSDQLSHYISTLNVGDNCISRGVDKGNLRNEQDLNKLDISNKQEFDVILEANKHLSARFKNLNAVETGKKSMKTLGRILSVSSKRDEQNGSGFAQMRFSLYNAESSFKISNGREGSCLSPPRPNTEVSSCDADMMKSNGESKTVEMDSIKYQDEHRSPVSVLEPFFIEDANSPPSVMLQTDGQQLKPLRLDFEECSIESSPQDPPNSCIQEQNHLSQYVHSVLQASCLNWDQLSEITSQPEELLDSFLFDQVEFLPSDCCFDPKLLFDRINEVLLEIYKYPFCSPSWLAFVKPKIRSVPLLAELVLGEIMTEADFFLLPRTDKRTLDQLVSKDVAKCRPWIDVRLDTQEIVIQISEDVLEESILDILLEFYTWSIWS